MTSNESRPLGERFSATARSIFEALSEDDRATVTECIKYLRANPTPDGETIYDAPLYPLMFRSMKCKGFLITFKVESAQARIYAIIKDDGDVA